MTTITNKSDRVIQDDVRAELVWRPEVEDAEVGVSVLGGVVTLSGEVDTYAQRVAAKKAALSVLGVSVVANDLTIRRAVRSQHTDTDVAVAIKQLLGWSTDVPRDRINVEVRDHVVHLTGTLEWDYQRRDVVQMVRRVDGVHHVENQITLTPRASSPDTATRIKAAMVRHALVDASSVVVTT
ncbi:MAG: transporter, partial [Nocardioidaceae bacterium]|nr:transporter [Nocardioidaceae bacterium]